MATGAYPPAETSNEVAVIPAFSASFQPELWTMQIIASFKSNLVMGNLVTNWPHEGQAGDAINIPSPTRIANTSDISDVDGTDPFSNHYATVPHDPVTLVANTEGVTQILMDQNYQIGRLVKDTSSIQSLRSLLDFYADDIGYGLALKVDALLHQTGSLLQGGSAYPDYGGAVIGSDGSTAWSATSSGNAAALSDAGIRHLVFTLDDADVPQRDRALVIPPIEKKNLLGLARFTEQAFVGEMGSGNSIRNGLIGDIYGTPVYVSTNCPTINAADSTDVRVGLMMHKTAMALVMQKSIRIETQRKLEHFGTLIAGEVLFGVGEQRDDAGIPFVVPAS